MTANTMDAVPSSSAHSNSAAPPKLFRGVSVEEQTVHLGVPQYIQEIAYASIHTKAPDNSTQACILAEIGSSTGVSHYIQALVNAKTMAPPPPLPNPPTESARRDLQENLRKSGLGAHQVPAFVRIFGYFPPRLPPFNTVSLNLDVVDFAHIGLIMIFTFFRHGCFGRLAG